MLARSFILLSILYTTSALAQGEDSFLELQRKVDELVGKQEQEKIAQIADITKKTTDCPKAPLSRTMDAGSSLSQYIYNDRYEWTAVPTTEGICVTLNVPFKRYLSKNEANYLLTASVLEFPVDANAPKTASEDELRDYSRMHDDMPVVQKKNSGLG